MIGGLLGILARFTLQRERAKNAEALERFRIDGAALLEGQRTAGAKDIFVHQMQFEKEFRVYEELWAQLVHLAIAASDLRPIIDHIDPNVPEPERKKKRLDKLFAAYNGVTRTVHDNQPFYAPRVYDKAREILKIAREESRQYRRHSPDRDAYYDEAGKNIDSITDLIQAVCEEIRARVWPGGRAADIGTRGNSQTPT